MMQREANSHTSSKEIPRILLNTQWGKAARTWSRPLTSI